MIYKRKPKNFNPKFTVVSCFCEYQSKIIFLHRQDHKPEGDKWGVPAGKIDPGETPKSAIVREIWEETGLKVNQSDLKNKQKLFVKYANYDFIYYMFSVELTKAPKIKINPNEHKNFTLKTHLEALEMELIEDEDRCIKLFYRI